MRKYQKILAKPLLYVSRGVVKKKARAKKLHGPWLQLNQKYAMDITAGRNPTICGDG